MMLGIDKIHTLIKKKGLLKNLSARELQNPEGAGIDLRLGALYTISGEGFLGIQERKTSKAEVAAEFDPKRIRRIRIVPGKYYTMNTVEAVDLPSNIFAMIFPRSTLYRSGVTLFSGNVAPGYQGKLTFGLMNFGTKPFTIEMGARVAHIIFHEVKGQTKLYRGQWQGGRVSTHKKEKQV